MFCPCSVSRCKPRYPSRGFAPGCPQLGPCGLFAKAFAAPGTAKRAATPRTPPETATSETKTCLEAPRRPLAAFPGGAGCRQGEAGGISCQPCPGPPWPGRRRDRGALRGPGRSAAVTRRCDGRGRCRAGGTDPSGGSWFPPRVSGECPNLPRARDTTAGGSWEKTSACLG